MLDWTPDESIPPTFWMASRNGEYLGMVRRVGESWLAIIHPGRALAITVRLEQSAKEALEEALSSTDSKPSPAKTEEPNE